jgi:XTP/dITP diphosphohydrolase
VAKSRRIVVASQNPGKVREIGRILIGYQILSLSEFPEIVFPEEGGDYAENARVKAMVAARATGEMCVADDSGLEVEALGGRPGAYSARYGGSGLDDRGRLEKMLDDLAGFSPPRRARFYCIAACSWPDGSSEIAEGICEGGILEAPRGAGGFGYDPIFQPEGFDRAMAEISSAEKDGLSHRGRAFRALGPLIDARVSRDSST